MTIDHSIGVLKLADLSPLVAIPQADTLAGAAFSHAPRRRGWGHRLLARFKTVNGRRYQLHATRGWKCIGKAQETRP